MLNKKVLLSVLIIGTIAVVAGAGTFAFFDSTSTVSDNTITAGTLTLGNPVTTSFVVENAIPGDIEKGVANGEYTLTNGGSINGYLSVTPSITSADATILTNLHIYINGEELIDGEPLELNANMAPAGTQGIVITYSYDDTGVEQNSEQGAIVECDLVYNLKQI